MAVQRKRFRIEDLHDGGAPFISLHSDPDGSHGAIMTELRAIREQLAPGAGGEHRALLETYRAQIEQCEKLKVELDLIHAAITRTKQEIAALHGRSFDGAEMTKVTGELGAVVGGTEEATQRILEAAEEIDQASAALAGTPSADQQARLTQDIQEKVIQIFEACNFQDLTGQRIGKVMATMKFIEQHIGVMMEIWGGIDAIKQHAPVMPDHREGDAQLLNGPRRDGETGHASQDDIDALFN